MTTPSSYELKEIKKRDGTLVQFDKEKIHHAILKAVLAVGGDDTTEVERLTDIVLTKATGVSKEGNKIITVEEIQDLVEKALIEEGHAKTAKAYILYRNQRKQTRDARAMLLDINKVMGEYLNQDDWRVKENSNISYSSAGLLMHLSGTLIANYTLNNIYYKTNSAELDPRSIIVIEEFVEFLKANPTIKIEKSIIEFQIFL